MIVVIEPHPDDAFLSLGWHLAELWKEEERVIVTVYCNEKRGKEAEAYAKAIGARSVTLGLEESNLRSSGPTTPPEALAALLGDYTGARLLFPLGLQHPDHLRVAKAAPRGAERYVEVPYQTKQMLQKELRLKMKGKVVRSIVYPPSRKKALAKVFKSQGMFFHYNPLACRIPEIVLGVP